MSESKPVMTGGCQCGAVRYAVHAETYNHHICHCRMCQKQFGGFFAPLVNVRNEDFEVTRGEIATFRSSRDVPRGFCAACGTAATAQAGPKFCAGCGQQLQPGARFCQHCGGAISS